MHQGERHGQHDQHGGHHQVTGSCPGDHGRHQYRAEHQAESLRHADPAGHQPALRHRHPVGYRGGQCRQHDVQAELRAGPAHRHLGERGGVAEEQQRQARDGCAGERPDVPPAEEPAGDPRAAAVRERPGQRVHDDRDQCAQTGHPAECGLLAVHPEVGDLLGKQHLHRREEGHPEAEVRGEQQADPGPPDRHDRLGECRRCSVLDGHATSEPSTNAKDPRRLDDDRVRGKRPSYRRGQLSAAHMRTLALVGGARAGSTEREPSGSRSVWIVLAVAAGLADRRGRDVVDRVLLRRLGRHVRRHLAACSASWRSVATVIDSASTWKCRRSACRVSLMPKPSVPSDV